MQSKMSISPKKLSLPKLYFLHGFLGDPEDWNEVIAHLPGYTCVALRYPFQLPSDGILIGYSMGGRIALTSALPKILISAHPGLVTTAEKEARWKQDQEWMKKLQTKPLSQFLQEWYEQPLFQPFKAHANFTQILERRQRQDPNILVDQLKNHSLAHQPLIQPTNATFMQGTLDDKYQKLYQRLKIPSVKIEKSGHVCHLEQPVAVAQAILNIIKNPVVPM
jgi:2-succinyl-6-hydroxy-2,4-cyclohexadiene-1-carboxylate synthase